ncbi:MAG: NAD-dependent succinate-semialdehyde dehydrogenase [Salibacteraceae bacterium]
MTISSINPYNLEVIERFTPHTEKEVETIVESVNTAFKSWRKSSFEDRAQLMRSVADQLLKRKSDLARTITLEMGKPIKESIAEIEKCAWVCRYYADEAEGFLQPRQVETDASQSFVTYEPLGVIYAIMPWNFPFWQVFRFAAPTLMAGNTAILKHAPNVCRCALEIEKLFDDAGFPENVFRTVILTNENASKLIEHPLVRGVSLTGSERAGIAVAGTAGKSLKPSLLELGGSNAVIVLEDADIDKAVETGFNARFLNSGQSCIAGKRFLVHKALYDAYLERFVQKVKAIKSGDPMNEDTRIGPLARVDLAEGLERQVNESVQKGAAIATGGKRKGAYFEPTVLTHVAPGMPAFDEELFGPVAPFLKINSLDEAIELSNRSSFGLGVTVCTGHPENVLKRVSEFDEGAVFINELVKSDPRLPFGGIKRSGYGRELSREGILEFVNVKTVYVK